MLSDFLTFLEHHQVGLLILGCIITFLAIIANWFFRIFQLGRYKPIDTKPGHRPVSAAREGFGFLMGKLMSKVIYEFRHLLALLILLTFVGILIYSMKGESYEDKIDALKEVMSTLGVLVVSIVGYYFGESSVLKNNNGSEGSEGGDDPEQGDPDPITPVVDVVLGGDEDPDEPVIIDDDDPGDSEV